MSVRDIRIQVSLSRLEYEKLCYLADVTGIRLGAYCYGVLGSHVLECLPEHSKEAEIFDLARRLKRAGQGYKEFLGTDLEERVNEAIEHGHTGVVPGGSH